jgi:hypothetical protein
MKAMFAQDWKYCFSEFFREKMLDKTLADSYWTSDPSSTIPNPSEDSL